MILSIETGGDICSVALSEGKSIISLRESDGGRNHAQLLALFIKEVLEENNLEVSELDAIAVGQGPGSYTGLRIGVSVAKGMCYGASIPLIAVGSLESLAEIVLEDFEVGILPVDSLDDVVLVPMIDARRMEVYTQLFDSQAAATTPVEAKIITAESFSELADSKKVLIFGSGAQKCLDTLALKNVEWVNVVQSARGVALRASKLFESKTFEDVAYFEPHYLKEFMAGTPKKLL